MNVFKKLEGRKKLPYPLLDGLVGFWIPGHPKAQRDARELIFKMQAANESKRAKLRAIWN